MPALNEHGLFYTKERRIGPRSLSLEILLYKSAKVILELCVLIACTTTGRGG